MKNFLLTLCTICIFEPKVIDFTSLNLNKKLKAKRVVVKEIDKPDIVSRPARIEDYYNFNKKTGRWVWSGK